MKYLKTYEENILLSSNNKCWKVKTSIPFFEISLRKIGMPEKKIVDFMKLETCNDVRRYDYVYVGIEHYPSSLNGVWTWDEDDFNGCEYMGNVIVTPDDIEKWKINNDANKFNL